MYVSLRVCVKKTTHLRSTKEKVPQISKKMNANTCKTAQPSAPHHVSSSVASTCKNLHTSNIWALTVKRKVGQSGRSKHANKCKQKPAACPSPRQTHGMGPQLVDSFLSLLPLLIYLSTLVSCNPGMPYMRPGTACPVSAPCPVPSWRQLCPTEWPNLTLGPASSIQQQPHVRVLLTLFYLKPGYREGAVQC